MFRLIITIIAIAIDFILAIPLFAIDVIIGLFSKSAQDKMSKIIIKVYLSVIAWISGCNVTYKGLENIPKDEAVLYVGNHNSFYDIIFTYPILPGVAGYVAKKELKKIPFLAQSMMLIHCVFLDRDNIKEGLKTILKCIEYIKSGISMFVFPEGTRSRDGKMLEFKEGSMKIATKSGCPIIPVAISNSAEVFENHLPKIKAVHVIIEFGKPIIASELDKEKQKHLGKELHDLIESMKLENDKMI